MSNIDNDRDELIGFVALERKADQLYQQLRSDPPLALDAKIKSAAREAAKQSAQQYQRQQPSIVPQRARVAAEPPLALGLSTLSAEPKYVNAAHKGKRRSFIAPAAVAAVFVLAITLNQYTLHFAATDSAPVSSQMASPPLLAERQAPASPMLESPTQPSTETAALPQELEIDATATVTSVTGQEHELSLQEQSAAHQRINQLLTQAAEQMNRKRLTLPANDNASDTYAKVLKLDASNATAKQGLREIVEHYLRWAESTKRKGNYRKSLRYAETGLRVIPDHVGLLALRDEVSELHEQRLSQGTQPPTSAAAAADADRTTETDNDP